METALNALLAELDDDEFVDERHAATGLIAAQPLSAAEREEVRQEAEALVRSA